MKHFIPAIIGFILAITGCQKSNGIPTPATPTGITDTTQPPAISVTKSYLALGDSYTIGQSVDSSQRFPAQTAALLKVSGITIKPLQYIATTGWTTRNLQNAISTQNLQNSFDVVSLLIGVNDQYQGLDTAGYRTRFTQLLQTSIVLAGGKATHVFVLSIPDYSVTPFGGNSLTIRQQVDDFNGINKSVVLLFAGVTYLDVTPSTRLAATDASLIAFDGLHPSGKEYNVWATMLAPLLLQVLR